MPAACRTPSTLSPTTDESRRIIQQTIAFWKSNLEPVPQPSWKPSLAREVVAALYGNNPQKSVEILARWIAENPKDWVAYQQMGRNLTQLQRYDEANAAYEKALELGGSDAGFISVWGKSATGKNVMKKRRIYLARRSNAARETVSFTVRLAFAQLSLNRNEEAIKTYEKAFEAGIPPGANDARAGVL